MGSHPTELELLILRVLWDESPLPVREIRRRLADGGRDLAHTTVITTLNNMFDKGQLRRSKDGIAFLFSPVKQQEEVSQGMLADLLDRVFDGSAAAVMLSLFETADLQEADLKELRRLFNQKIKERKQ